MFATLRVALRFGSPESLGPALRALICIRRIYAQGNQQSLFFLQNPNAV